MTFHPASHRGDGSSLSDRRSVKTRVVLAARFSQMTASPLAVYVAVSRCSIWTALLRSLLPLIRSAMCCSGLADCAGGTRWRGKRCDTQLVSSAYSSFLLLPPPTLTSEETSRCFLNISQFQNDTFNIHGHFFPFIFSSWLLDCRPILHH